MTPKLQKPAPEFSGTAVVNGEFKEISLKDFRGKYVVLFFWPLDFTFVCPTEIIAFSDRAKDFKAIGCEIIGASCDSHYSHLAWVNTPREKGGIGAMEIPLLADKTGKIAREYGIYDEDTGIPFRGLFIIDGKGILRQITVNDLPVGRSVDETLRLVQAFQFTDAHGEAIYLNASCRRNTILGPKPKKTRFKILKSKLIFCKKKEKGQKENKAIPATTSKTANPACPSKIATPASTSKIANPSSKTAIPAPTSKPVNPAPTSKTVNPAPTPTTANPVRPSTTGIPVRPSTAPTSKPPASTSKSDSVIR